jgi:hypothetical protein
LNFIIPAQNYPNFSFPLNTPISFDCNTNFYKKLSANGTLIFSPSQVFIECDSVTVNLVITRNSKGTIDGTFSALLYTRANNGTATSGTGVISNGVFTNVPISTQ